MMNVRKKHAKTKWMVCLMSAAFIGGLFSGDIRGLYLDASLCVYRLAGGNWFFCEALQGKIEFIDIRRREAPKEDQPRMVELTKDQQQVISKLLKGAKEEEIEDPEAGMNCMGGSDFLISPAPLGWYAPLGFDADGGLMGYILSEENDKKLRAEIIVIGQSFTNPEKSL